MPLDETLRAVLACPRCKQALDYRPRPETLDCAPCGLRFRVDDGVPILLIDEAEAIRPAPAG
ncbi:MAG: Trm112 family protein [Nitrospirae bacterium]|nr:Trm112 family protein [Nitrospirota bacterium]